jgi:nucleoside-diphosphate-sugar epimerase
VSRLRPLVTGATGLIGSSLLAALRRQGLDAHGVARSAHGSGMHAADLRSASATGAVLGLVEPTTVVHLVGGHHPDPARLTELNAGTLSNVMQAAADLATVPMVIAVGSAAEYGEPADGVVSESSPTEPVSAYGRAKLAATSRAMELSEATGVPLCVVRPFNVVSPHLGADTALGNLRRQLLAQSGSRRVVRCGRLDIVRDFVPLDYVVEVLAAVAILPAPPAVLNVCSGTGILLEDVLHALAASLDASVTVESVPELTAIPAPERIVGDSRLLAQLGFSCRPTPASLASVLLDSV